MADSNITYFDLDEVVPEQVVVKLKGIEYALKAVSVDDFIKNSQMLGKIEAAVAAGKTDIEETFSHTLDLLKRAFPTMGEEIIRGMSMTQMNKLVSLAHGMNGQKDAEASAAAAATANPPKAGS